MRKALREKAEGLKTHEELVANQLKRQQNLLDERGNGETVTEAERAILVFNILKWEEKEIQRFASHNCYLKTNPILDSVTSPLPLIKMSLANKKYLFKNGEISAEELQVAKEKALLQTEAYDLQRRLINLLMFANNYG